MGVKVGVCGLSWSAPLSVFWSRAALQRWGIDLYDDEPLATVTPYRGLDEECRSVGNPLVNG